MTSVRSEKTVARKTEIIHYLSDVAQNTMYLSDVLMFVSEAEPI